MPQMTMIQALRSAMDVMLERNPDVVVFGEDVGYFGGVFRVTEGLQAKYGKSRCFDAPISEGGLVGTAVGMGAYGLRPVVEIMYADFALVAGDQLMNQVAKVRYMYGDQFNVPLVVRMKTKPSVTTRSRPSTSSIPICWAKKACSK